MNKPVIQTDETMGENNGHSSKHEASMVKSVGYQQSQQEKR